MLFAWVKKRLKPLLRWLDRASLAVFGRGRWLAPLYLLSHWRGYRREVGAIATGRWRFFSGADPRHHARMVLRRNIHRLEKGLSMPRRRAVFALDYLGETLHALDQLSAPTASAPALASTAVAAMDSDITWATEVLTLYFATVKDPRVAAPWQRFCALSAPLQKGTTAQLPRPVGLTHIPRPQAELPRSGVTYAEYLALCHQRHAVRTFLQRPVPLQRVQQALTAALQAPSACNRQSTRLLISGSAAAAQKIAACAMGTAGFRAGIPMMVVVLGDLSAYAEDRDRHLPYIDGALMAMQFMLALETLGLSSCPINWPELAFYERRLATLLALETHQRPVMLLAVGYADPEGLVPCSSKRPVAQIMEVFDGED